MTGKGTLQDPKRPLYAPLPQSPIPKALAPNAAPPTPSGILGYSYQMSDDGEYALVEFVARNRSEFNTMLADPAVVRSFVKGSANIADVVAVFKTYKKDFDFSKLGVRVP